MYKEGKNEEKTKVIDFEKARLCLNPEGFDSVEQKQKETQKAQVEQFKKIVGAIQEKTKANAMVLSRDNVGTYCTFSKDLDPFDDLLPMFLAGIMTVVGKHKLDGLNYVSALFTATYNCLMEEAQCKMCSKHNSGQDRCDCTDDCENCPKND